LAAGGWLGPLAWWQAIIAGVLLAFTASWAHLAVLNVRLALSRQRAD
jgi:hypothetical protein